MPRFCPVWLPMGLAVWLFSAGLPAVSRGDTPSPPSSLTLAPTTIYVGLSWINPSTNTDGSALTDFGGVRIYRNSVLVGTMTRPRGAAGTPDSWNDPSPDLGSLTYYVTALDRESPILESAPSNSVTWNPSPPGTPVLHVSPASVSRTVVTNFQISADQLSISATGTSAGAPFAITDDVPWLSLSTNGGTIPLDQSVSVTLTLSTVGLAPGPYTGTVHITGGALPIDVPVQLEVVATATVMDPPSLTFSIPWGGTQQTQSVTIHNYGPLGWSWTPSVNRTWLTMSPSEPFVLWDIGGITVTADPYALAPGTYTGTASAGAAAVGVTLNVLPVPPVAAVWPAQVMLTRADGAPTQPVSILLTNAGSEPLNFSVSESVPWLSVTPSTGTVPGDGAGGFEARLTPGALPPGPYDADLVIQTNDPVNPTRIVPVHLEKVAAPEVSAPAGIKIQEAGFLCHNGNVAVQFVELQAIDGAQTFSSALGLRVENRNGQVVFDQTGLFAPHASSDPWPAGSSWLLAPAAFQAAAGLAPDQVLSLNLDPLGGKVILYDVAAGGATRHQFSWGATGNINAAAPGHSIEIPGSSPVERAIPAPMNAAGFGPAEKPDCPCPASYAGAATYNGPYGDYSLIQSGGRDVYVHADVLAGTIRVGSSRDGVNSTLNEVFWIEGLPAGTPVTFQARLQGQYAGGSSGPPSGGNYGSALFRVTEFPANTDELHTPQWGGSGFGSVSIPVSHAALEPFTLTYVVQTTGGSHGGGGSFNGTFDFLDLPPGARIQSCRGYSNAAAVPLAVAVTQAEYSNGAVTVTWLVPEGTRELKAERREAEGEWLSIGAPEPVAGDLWQVVDRSVTPGRRYAYRLRSAGETGGEAAVLVPLPNGLAMSAEPFERGDSGLRVHIVTPKAGTVTLVLFDVAGRRVNAVDLTLEGGESEVTVPADGLRSGVYFLRASQDRLTANTRFVVIR